jgi:hypothetical protein
LRRGTIVKVINRPLDGGIAETPALVGTVVALAVLLATMGIMGAVASLIAYLVSTAFALYRAARALEVSAVGLLLPRSGVWSRSRALEAGRS